jgi:hypothetical protein
VKDPVEKVLAFEQLKFEPPKSDAEIAAEAAEHAAKAAKLRGQGVARRAPPDYAILSLSPDHNLVDAIAALISDASLPASDLDRYKKRFAPLSVSCDTPWLSADIHHYDRSVWFTARYRMPSKPMRKRAIGGGNPSVITTLPFLARMSRRLSIGTCDGHGLDKFDPRLRASASGVRRRTT